MVASLRGEQVDVPGLLEGLQQYQVSTSTSCTPPAAVTGGQGGQCQSQGEEGETHKSGQSQKSSQTKS